MTSLIQSHVSSAECTDLQMMFIVKSAVSLHQKPQKTDVQRLEPGVQNKSTSRLMISGASARFQQSALRHYKVSLEADDWCSPSKTLWTWQCTAPPSEGPAERERNPDLRPQT
ncbi:hypothetical protein WMY93_001592 [Mugilogobius chulae]|uniref:Uncharacterized protein n=1 Tax=Mugilogobius chulae TaxID=88201 RepID=A0AAW0PX61_9GOBI